MLHRARPSLLPSGRPEGRHPARFWRRVALLLPLLCGCGSDTTSPALLTAAQAYWALHFNHTAVMLALTAPYDTAQLIATPVNANGDPLSGLGPVTYQATDTNVTVSPTGVITAHGVTEPGTTSAIIATLRDTTQGITHVDTALVAVTAVPLAITSYSMQPVPGDSAKRALDWITPYASPWSWPVRVTTAAGVVCDATTCPLVVSYTSSVTRVANVGMMVSNTEGFAYAATGLGPAYAAVVQHDTGATYFTASTLAYGRVLRDSIQFTIGFALHAWVYLDQYHVGDSFVVGTSSHSVTLGIGAVIDFVNRSLFGSDPSPLYGPVTIQFSRPASVDSATDNWIGGSPTGTGNIVFACDSVTNVTCFSPNELVKARRFPVAGVYHLHNSVNTDSITVFIRNIP